MDKYGEHQTKIEVARASLDKDFSMFGNPIIENGVISESIEIDGVGTLTVHANPEAEKVHGPDNLAVVFNLNTGYKDSVISQGKLESGQAPVPLGPNYVMYAKLADGTSYASLGQKSYEGKGDKFSPKVEIYHFDSWLPTDPDYESVHSFKGRSRASQRVGQPLNVKGDPKAVVFRLTK